MASFLTLQIGCTFLVTANNEKLKDVVTDAGVIQTTDAGDAGLIPFDAGFKADAGPSPTTDAGFILVDGGASFEFCAAYPCFLGVICEDTPTGAICGSCPTGFVGDGYDCVEGTTSPADVYAASCASCHGDNGEGGSGGPLNRAYSKAELFKQTALMPPSSTGPDCGGPTPCTLGMVEFLFRNISKELRTTDDGKNNISGFVGATLLTPKQTLRKATLLFAQRLPTDIELQDLSEENLGIRIQEMMNGEGFTRFLLDGANELLLTRKFIDGAPSSSALEIFSDNLDHFHYFQASTALNPRLNTSFENANAPDAGIIENQLYEQEIYETNRAFAEEPLRLIAHVVQNNRPYTEILTARYVMMNPYLNDFYLGRISFDDVNDPQEWKQGAVYGYQLDAQNPLQGQSNSLIEQVGYSKLPTSGILSSPTFLTRYPSTATNKHRARANAVYQIFLGVDLDERSEAAHLDGTDIQNPQALGSSCRDCHELLDPIAATYQNWGHRGTFLDNATPDYANNTSFRHALSNSYVFTDNGAVFRYQFGDRWYRIEEDLDIHPGYPSGAQTLPMPTTGGQLYKDIDRTTGFADGVQWLGGQMAIDPRFARGTTLFWAKSVYGFYPKNSSTALDDEIDRLAAEFWNTKKLKDLFVAMSLSPLFRLTHIDLTQHERGIQHLNKAGVGRFSNPDFFAKKFEAITRKSWNNGFLNEYFSLFGGIDSEKTTEHPLAMTPLSATAYEYLAQLQSCDVVQAEFALAPEERVLFSDIELTDTPGLSNLTDEALKIVLQNLYFRFLGAELQSEAPELERAFTLLQDVFTENFLNPSSTDLCDEVNPVAQAWMAILYYLMGDPAFIYE